MRGLDSGSAPCKPRVEQDAKALQARAVFRVWLVRDGAGDVLHGLSLLRGLRGGIRCLEEIESFLAALHGRKEAGGGPCVGTVSGARKSMSAPCRSLRVSMMCRASR